MGKLILIDFKKRAEHQALSDLLSHYGSLMDLWLAEYGTNDPTPPNKEECTMLETDKIAELIHAFSTNAAQLIRVQDEVPGKLATLTQNLTRRRGGLERKFSKTVAKLQDQASATLQYCVDAWKECCDTSLSSTNFPMAESDIVQEITKCLAHCELYIANTFPDGVAGLAAYDNPDQVPPDKEEEEAAAVVVVATGGFKSYAQWKEHVAVHELQRLQEFNKASIPNELARITFESKRQFQQQINAAIRQAMTDMEADLAEDHAPLPFLTDDEMTGFRAGLLASAKAYGESRLDKEEDEEGDEQVAK
jgi:hypothetical protein